MSDSIRIQDGAAVEIWPNTPKASLVFTDEIMATIVEAPAGTVKSGDAWNGTSFSRPAVDLVAYAASKRFAIETAGITVGGTAIDTDRASQAQIVGAVAYVQQNPAAVFQWKAGPSTFVSLDAAAIVAVGNAVGAHVQACFAKEAEVDASIAGGAITTTDAIDAAFAGVA
jgi:hypothetical protein